MSIKIINLCGEGRWRNMKNADRKSPLKKVIKVYQNVYGDLVEVLECSHEIIIKADWWGKADRRRCKACAQNLAQN